MKKYRFIGTHGDALMYDTNIPLVNGIYPENTVIGNKDKTISHWVKYQEGWDKKEWEEVIDPEVEKQEILAKVNKPIKALRYNDGKVQWSLVDFKSLEPFVRVLEFGAKKYSKDNWKQEMDLDKILDSAQRHMASMIDGENIDQESGLQHAAHVICNMMFYIYHYNKNEKV